MTPTAARHGDRVRGQFDEPTSWMGGPPRALTSLIGRSAAVDAVTELVASHRLVALTGTGGVGKTRVAIEVARRTAELASRVWWLDLAPLSSSEMLRAGLVSILGGADAHDRSVADLTVGAIGDERVLLILDNCEHLLGGVAEVVRDVLDAAPNLNVLITTREPIGLSGERIWRVPSLSLVGPSGPTSSTTSSPGMSAAVELFVERARDVRSDLPTDAASLDTIAAICERLDGIPLAIELAAARCRHLAPAAIHEALHDRFRLLTGGTRTVLARHRTMRMSMDWSYQLLDEVEQRTIRTLGVFRDGFTLAAARAVVTDVHGVASAGVPEVVGHLVDKNMVAFDGDQYRLLDTVRAYVTERAELQELTASRDAHADWFTAWLAETVAGMRANSADQEISRCEPDVIAALEWSQATPARAATMVESLAGYWYRNFRVTDIASLGLDTLEVVRQVDLERWAGLACLLAYPGVVADCGPFLDVALPAAIELAIANGHHASASLGLRAIAYRRQSWMHGAAALSAAREADDEVLIMRAASQLCIIGLATADPLIATNATAALDACRPRAGSVEEQSIALARAYIDFTSGAIESSGRRFAELIALEGAADPTIGMTSLIGTCMIGLLGHDDQLLRSGMEAVDAAAAARRATAGVAATLHWSTDRSKPIPPFRVLLGPFASLWRAVGALALVESSEPAQALALLAEPPTDQAAGSFLAVAGAAVRTSIAHMADADDVDGRWREVLADSERYGYRMLAVDALEALASRSTNTPRAAGRLLGAAEQLRRDTGYLHRFRFQQAWVDLACTTADGASRAEGAGLDWHTVAEWVRRRWGERHRPSVGWASLTPTEHRVVELVASGLTNPQIADRLLMSRSTVKTHLAHVFVKLGVTTRTELATVLIRREAR